MVQSDRMKDTLCHMMLVGACLLMVASVTSDAESATWPVLRLAKPENLCE